MADNGFEQLRETAESRFPGRVARLEDGAFAIVRDALGRRGRQALHDRAKGVVLVRRRLDAERSGYSADSDGDAREASAANAENIAKASAAKLAADVASTAATKMTVEQYRSGNGFVDTDAIASIVNHALKPIISGDLPMHRDMYDAQVLDGYHLKHDHLSPKADEISALVRDIMKSPKLGGEKIDKHYAKHIIDTLFNKDGTPSGKTIDDLKTPIQVKVDVAFRLNEKLRDPRPHTVYKALNKANVNPEERIKLILGFCGDDDELKQFALRVAPNLCVNSNMGVRSEADIQKKIAGLKQSLDEIRMVELGRPGIGAALRDGLAGLEGGSFPPGMLSRMANAVDNEKFDKLVHLNSLSSAADIYEGIVQLHSIIENICNQVNVTQSFVDNGEDLNSVGEAQAFASKTAITALAFAKMGPGFTARLQGLLHGGEIDTLRRVSA